MSELAYVVESDKSMEVVSGQLDKLSPEHNFRVLAIHNVQATLADKGFKIEPLKIYEVCNAGFAFKALSKDINVSMFMPCKIVLRQEGKKTVITLVRPGMISTMLPGAGLDELASEVEKQLMALVDEIK